MRTVDMPTSQPYNDRVRKFTLNYAARGSKTSARMFKPTKHIFL